MPVRVLDGNGAGRAGPIARGMRWAVDHGADVINVSIELVDQITAAPQSMTVDPLIREAVRYAAAHNVLVVGRRGQLGQPRRAVDAPWLRHPLRRRQHRARLPRRVLQLRQGRRSRGAWRRRRRADLRRPALHARGVARAQRRAGVIQAPVRRHLPDHSRSQRAPRPERHLDGRAARHGGGRAAAELRRAGRAPDAGGDPGRLRATARDLGPGPSRATTGRGCSTQPPRCAASQTPPVYDRTSSSG